MSTLARLNIVVDADAAKRSLRSLESVAKRSASIVQGAFQRSLSIFKNITRQLFSLKAAFISLGAGLIIRDFIKVANTLEQVNTQLLAVTKSQDTANKIFKKTRQFATEVSFEFEELVGATARMAAQLKGNVDDVDFFLRASADVAATTGMTVEDAAGQFMRMMAGGAGAADQFRERGVLAMMGFQQGATYSLDQVQKKIRDAFEEGGSVLVGNAKVMSSTLNGTISMIKDKFFAIKAALMEAGVFDFIKDAASFINNEMDAALSSLSKNAATVGSTVTTFLDDMVIYAAGTIDGMVNLTRQVLGFFDSFRKAYNRFNELAGGKLAAFGLIGFLIFGRKGGIIGILTATLMGVADYISSWLAETLSKIMGVAASALGSTTSGFSGLSLSDALKESGSSEYQTESQLAALENDNALLGRVTKMLNMTQSADGTFSSAGQFTGPKMLEGFYDAIKGYEANFKNQAEQYKNSEIGFRSSANKLIEKVMDSGFVQDVIGPNIKPLDVEVKEYTGATDYLNNFLEHRNNQAELRAAAASVNPVVNDLIKPDGPIAATDNTAYNRRLRGFAARRRAMKDDADSDTTATGSATPLAAHILQQQLTDAITVNIEKLKSGEITFKEFNNQKELMTKLIAAEIPLVGALTAEQQKEKDGIIALFNQTKKYEKMLEKLGITYQDTTNNITKGFLTAAAVAGNTAEKTMQFGQQMYQSLEDGLDSFITSGDFKFRNFMLNLAQQFLVMQAQLALSRLTTTLFGGMLAGGGPVMPNRAYVVGERGREVFQPNQAGRMIPNNELGGGGVTIHQSFDFRNADQFTEARLRQQAAVIKESTRNSIYQDMQDGGSVSKISGRR